MSDRQVTLVVFDGFTLLDLAGPVDVFRTASRLGAQPGFRLVIASPDGDPVRSNSGIAVTPDSSIAAAADLGATDTLLVTGGAGVDGLIESRTALGGIRRIAERARRTTSVCTGALVLAAAGLLDGYRATTHWAACDRMAAAYPDVSVEPDCIYVHDRDRWTSAGVTAGIDLTLALVEADHGTELAHSVAGWLVVFVRRPGGQSQFSAQMRTQPARTPAILELQRWLPDHLADDLCVDTLAARAGMSPRNFARVFRAEVGVTPAALVEGLRVEAARRLFESTDLTIEAIAAKAGWARPESLYRAFRRRIGTTPDSYRQHFQRRAS